MPIHSPTNRPRIGFTLIELLVVISIISLLISILLPALGQARKRAAEVQCLSNLRQINVASFNYSADEDGQYPVMQHRSIYGLSSQPYSYAFGRLVERYVPAPKSGGDRSSVWICPAEQSETWLANTPWAWNSTQDRARWRGTYWLPYRVMHPDKPDQARNPAWYYSSGQYWAPMNPDDGPYVWAHDGLTTNPGTGYTVGRATRHDRGYNAVYMDGSGEFFGGTAADELDSWITPYASVYYNASWASAARFFDVQRGVGGYASGPN